jgi:hypothetical protein
MEMNITLASVAMKLSWRHLIDPAQNCTRAQPLTMTSIAILAKQLQSILEAVAADQIKRGVVANGHAS